MDFRAKHLAVLHFDCEHTGTRLCQLSSVCYYRTCCCRSARLVHHVVERSVRGEGAREGVDEDERARGATTRGAA